MPPVFTFLGGAVTGLTTGVAAGAGVAGAYAAGMTFGASFLGGTIGKLLTSVAMSALQQAIVKKSSSGGGLAISTTLRGEQNPETILLGRTATSGQLVCPPMSHGKSNVTLTHVVELCSAPGATLERVILGDDYVELGPTPNPLGYGYPVVTPKFMHGDTPLVWVKYYDGSQTEADPMLRAAYGTHPERPWTAEMIGTGLCYAILTFNFNAKAGMTQVPRYRFEMRGIPLYDRRQDSTAGGLGPQRWSDPSTWSQSENPAVILWNVLRGIALPGGGVWGGQVAAEDLPHSTWTEAMNLCDAPVTLAEGGTEPRYRCGIEAPLTQEPSAVAAELLKACAGQLADTGGAWVIRCGGPALPVHLFEDDDVIVSRPQELDPFPTLGETWNAVTAQYPDPEARWETRDAPPRNNAEWEASDRFGRRTADLTLPAVPYKMQVQRLMRAWIEDERRFARHMLTLPPDATVLEPLDTVVWNSARNGYAAKSFEVAEVIEDIRSCIVQVSLREVDPADYAWSPAFELPSAPVGAGSGAAPPAVVSGFSATPETLTDAAGAPRRSAIRLSWDPDLLADGLTWEVRLAGLPAQLQRGTMQDPEAGTMVIAEGILPDTAYQARVRLLIEGVSEWSAWAPVTTPDVRLGADDVVFPAPDTVPPSVPAGLALSSTLVADGRARLSAVWSGVSDADLSGYEVRIRQSGGADISSQTSLTRAEWDVLTGTVYAVAVRALDRSGNASAWSSEQSLATAVDTLAPDVPTGVVATGTFGGIWLAWNRNIEPDLSHYEVAQRTVTTPPGAGFAPAWTLTTNQLVIDGLGPATTRHYWVRAVDRSGNRSAWSGIASATSTALQSADIEGIVAATSFATGIRPVEIVAALPATGNFQGRLALLTLDNKLYRHTGSPLDASGWTAVVPAGDIAGQIVATQITDLAITTPKLAASAVIAEKIAADAIEAGKIAVGAVNARELAAGSIVASKLAVGDATNAYPDYDMRDAAFYSSDGAGYTLNGVANQNVGDRELRLNANGEAWTGWCPIDGSADIRARAVTRGGVADPNLTGSVFVEFGSYNGGAITPLRRVLVVERSNSTTQTATEVNMTAAAAENRFRFVLVRSGSYTGSFVTMAGLRVRKRMTGELIVDGAITAAKVGANQIVTQAANIADAVITDAKIANLSAAKLLAGTALTGSLTVDGTALSTVRGNAATGAQDPVTRINAGLTQIDPGKIVISGATTLADWRRGGDQTRIDGGAISANTIDANKLRIGSRALTVTGVQFDYNVPGVNQVSWSAGHVRWINDAGSAISTAISAGSANWSSGVLYVYFDKSGTLKTTTNVATAFGADAAILATYMGGADLVTDHGRTVIDGATIKTGSITADRLQAGQIITDEMIVAGAVARKWFGHKVDLSTISDTKRTLFDFVFAAAPYFAISGRAANPIVIDLRGQIRPGTSGSNTVFLAVEGSDDDWASFVTLQSIEWAWPAGNQDSWFDFAPRIIDTTAVGGVGNMLKSGTTPYDKYRVTQIAVGATHWAQLAAGLNLVVEQISR